MADHLLPVNATPQDRAMAITIARLSDVPLAIRKSWSADDCPPQLLPWLAWATRVGSWSADWTDQQKKDAIKASLFIHQRKGTVAAMEAALDALGYDTSVTEWHRMAPRGDPYTFGVDIGIGDVGISSPDVFDQVVSVAEGAKNVRTHLTYVNMNSTRSGDICVGGVLFTGEIISISSGD